MGSWGKDQGGGGDQEQGVKRRGFCSCFLGHMEIQQQKGVGNSKVVKVEKEESWDLFINQASNEGRPVGFFFLALFFPHLFPALSLMMSIDVVYSQVIFRSVHNFCNCCL